MGLRTGSMKVRSSLNTRAMYNPSGTLTSVTTIKNSPTWTIALVIKMFLEKMFRGRSQYTIRRSKLFRSKQGVDQVGGKPGRHHDAHYQFPGVHNFSHPST